MEKIVTNRLDYHFEPDIGWMNDPNALCYYRGEYHAFFQYNPYSIHWDKMHWGHAVSKDLIHWKQKEIALYPYEKYEDDGGCFSGSAVIQGDRLWIFYTSVSKELGQTQSVAWSDDGETFIKYSGNPVIRNFPDDASHDFRDPKVFVNDGIWHMVLATGKNGYGKVLHYMSDNPFDWHYDGVLFESNSMGCPFECPDLYKIEDKWILSFSCISKKPTPIQHIIGDFDGHSFTEYELANPEMGPHIYATQSFEGPDHRRIEIGWLNSCGILSDDDGIRKGALSIPREIRFNNGKLCCVPIYEIENILDQSSQYVKVGKNVVDVFDTSGDLRCTYRGIINKIDILRDTRCIEVFINGGEKVITAWLGKQITVE